jgi:tetratricopeptide (TPR) repeat protein
MASLLLLTAVLLPVAHAEVPLPSYREDLALARWHNINSQIESACEPSPSSPALICSEVMLDKAIEDAHTFQTTLFPDARIEYLIGLSHRYAGRTEKAVAHYKRAVAQDPERQDAWHDLGETYLSQGRYDEARVAFEHVSALVSSGSHSWIGPWRLGEIAAHQNDPDTFEEHMREALRRGFSFNQIRGLANWRDFYANPALHDSIEKLVTVYGDPDLLHSLERK